MYHTTIKRWLVGVISAVQAACLVIAASFVLHAVEAVGSEGGSNGPYYTTVRLQDAATGATDIQGAFSNNNGVEGPAGASVLALPCPHHKYLFTADVAPLAGGVERTYTSHITMGPARLPHGFVCGHPLPAALGVIGFEMNIYRTDAGNRTESRFKIAGKRLTNGNLEAAVGNVTTSLCDGRYRFVAILGSGAAHLVLSYPFRLTDAKVKPHHLTCRG
jgi:hypothetical protein